MTIFFNWWKVKYYIRGQLTFDLYLYHIKIQNIKNKILIIFSKIILNFALPAIATEKTKKKKKITCFFFSVTLIKASTRSPSRVSSLASASRSSPFLRSTRRRFPPSPAHTSRWEKQVLSFSRGSELATKIWCRLVSHHLFQMEFLSTILFFRFMLISWIDCRMRSLRSTRRSTKGNSTATFISLVSTTWGIFFTRSFPSGSPTFQVIS